MKIVHICISERFIEGQSYQENLLARRHVQMGHAVFIIASNKYTDKNGKTHHRRPETYINHDDVTVTILKPFPQWRFTGTFTGTTRGLYARLVEIAPDIIMVHGVSAFENKTISKFVNNYPSTRLFVDNHNDYFNSPVNTFKKRLFKTIDSFKARKLLNNALMYWGTTPWRVQYLQEVYRIPAEKTGLLIMGADEKYIEGVDKLAVRKTVRASYCIPDDAFLVVTGGTLDKRKQQDLLFEAVSGMEGDNIWLLAFGSPTDEMKPIFERYKTCKNIVMTGWLPAEKAYDMFMASDLAFFPGTHSVLWEQAVACGTPLVVKHWSGIEHVNVNGNAIFLDEVTVDSIITLISEISSENKYKSMKIKANEIASNFYLTEIAKKAIGINE